jgi:Arc/MetJ family transcription regulator
MENFGCMYCGANVKVERAGGAISLKLVTEAIAAVQRGTDKTAAELAIRRLTGEIEEELLKQKRVDSELQEQRARVEAKKRAIRNQSSFFLLIIVFAVCAYAGDGIAGAINNDVAVPVGLISGLAGLFFVSHKIDKGRARQVAPLELEQKELEIEAERKIQAIKADIIAKTERLGKQRVIADA